MSTELILYLAEIIDNVREIVKVAFVLAVSSILVVVVFYVLAVIDKEKSYLDDLKRALHKVIWVAAAITLCFALIPSKNTINAMSGVKSEVCADKKEK